MQLIRTVVTACACFLIATSVADAQATIFVVRHAERADAGAPVTDPDLSAAGHARAEALSAVLRDAKVAAIYVTALKRTQQTAAPLAKALGLTPIVLPAGDTAKLIALLKDLKGVALVVGHSNTVPEIATALSGVAVTVGDADYDNLFVVSRPLGAAPSLLQLHYK